MNDINKEDSQSKPKTPVEYEVAFRTILSDMMATFVAKNHDYGSAFSTLFADVGMPYAYGHLAEKLQRVRSLMNDEAKVKGESMIDSLKDLANYSVLTIIELQRGKEIINN